MIRRALLAAALGALAACTDPAAPTETIGLRRPSALAVFRGLTLDAPATVRPYLAVANAHRNDLTIVDATDDTAVWAPVQLRPLAVPVAERPALLAATSLGDAPGGGPEDPAALDDDLPDLLVAVAAGDSVLQVVATWEPGNTVFSDPVPAGTEVPLAVDLGADVLALAAVPSPLGTARIAAALAGRRIAVVEYARAPGSTSIVRTGDPVSAQLAFQPIALAASPDDPAVAGVQTAIYAATLEPIAAGIYGVAELPPDLATPPRALDARGPTRLVAAALLWERSDTSTSVGAAAFDQTASRVSRVYAVLDESRCGLDRRVPCGVVTLDPVTAAIPPDWSGVMPYRAPVAVPGRPLALAVSHPPALPPGTEPEVAHYAGTLMRLLAGSIETATTAVAAVASDDGRVYFLDLGRFKAATPTSTLKTLVAGIAAPSDVDVDPSDTARLRRRLWVQQDDAGTFVPDTASGVADAAKAVEFVDLTPGWTRSTTVLSAWTITYQGVLPELLGRLAEAGADAGRPWLALQAGYGTAPARHFSQVVRLHHPALGVRVGDIAVVKAAGVPGCVGTRPPGTPADARDEEVAMEFEATVAEILPPDDARHPGGAVVLAALDATAHPEWAACVGALASLPAGEVLTRLTATLRAAEFVVTSTDVGYAGRPARDPDTPNAWHYALEYPTALDEDDLAGLCPLVDWDGTSAPPACDAATCQPACEAAVLARKARRVHHSFEDCSVGGDETWLAECTEKHGATFPIMHGPVIGLRVGILEVDEGAGTDPVRDMSLSISTLGGEAPISAVAAGSPFLASGAVAFDRSPANGPAGYRFLVSYAADMVLDVSPHVNPPEGIVIR